MTDEAMAAGEPSRAAIEAAAGGGLLEAVLDLPHQIGDALWRAESAQIAPRDLPGGLVVAGIGGSGVGGDLARAAIGNSAQRPIRTVRGYTLDPWIGPETLVLCASYSGHTEETLALFEAAGAAGCPRVALTTGGSLAEAARADGVPVIGVPSGMQPRAAVAYMIVGALECAALCGAAPPLRDELAAAATTLERLVAEWGPDAPAGAPPKRLARSLRGTVPVVHGAGPTAAVAARWKTQLNENAKRPAFASELPEANHNELCFWDAPCAAARLSAIFLDDPALDGRLRRRLRLTAEAATAGAEVVELVEGRGERPLERVLSLVLLGDLTSIYLAALDGVQATPVEAIERFKRALADRTRSKT